uniref:Uncharacterized protein n=1 Tax=Lotharella globosa TaxID=91324 RepID=A0A7S4DXF0_9EUKA|eukprot:CAMPEP_0167793298 /NCGR_PEP_ID=MMETSP0111_2-20121227/13086_1 /TAXON_ID=91324 /ORGANISM="Lotharella globosa, Strain CCCM811" /LENGTH=311 /DNA_ID=CAMNT_0007686407 /DNA_START=36 /DNA_END=971 /DNA_ORIENTATION=-
MHAVARQAFYPRSRPHRDFRASNGAHYDPQGVNPKKNRRVPKRRRDFREAERRVRRALPVAHIPSEEEYNPAEPEGAPFSAFSGNEMKKAEGTRDVIGVENNVSDNSEARKPLASASPWTKRYAPERYANANARNTNDNDDEKTSKTKRIRNLAEHYTSEYFRNAQSRGKRLSKETKDRVSAKMWRFAVVRIKMEELGLRRKQILFDRYPKRHVRDAVVRACAEKASSTEEFETAVQNLETKDFERIAAAEELGARRRINNDSTDEDIVVCVINNKRSSYPRQRGIRSDAPAVSAESRPTLRSGFSSWDIN